jgi:auxin influx carrier (AUX1 LAX family)
MLFSFLLVAQIISTASNLYLLDFGLDKRTLALITGAVMALVCFVPTYREYRVFSFLGLVATTYTAWYMVTASIIEGPAPDVAYDGPTSLKMFFTCFSSMIFMFGTHSASIEKADVMNKPSRYDIAYVFSMLYIYTITIPNGIAGYHTYGSVAATTSNAFYLYEDTIYRQIGVVLMCFHELVAFGLFAGPLFHMLEKSLNIDHRGYWICTASRFVIVAIMLLIAVVSFAIVRVCVIFYWHSRFDFLTFPFHSVCLQYRCCLTLG